MYQKSNKRKDTMMQKMEMEHAELLGERARDCGSFLVEF